MLRVGIVDCFKHDLINFQSASIIYAKGEKFIANIGREIVNGSQHFTAPGC